jgi:hypothetical protein
VGSQSALHAPTCAIEVSERVEHGRGCATAYALERAAEFTGIAVAGEIIRLYSCVIREVRA